jgi:hypothetical protein
MTSRPFLSRLGWPRPATPVHGHEVVSLELPEFGPVRLARWLHPDARRAPASVEPARVAAMRAHLHPGDVALVIGAAEGAEALELGLAVGPAGAVVALEADRAVFPVLAANAALNRDRIRLFPHLVAVARDGPPPPFGVEAQPLEPFLRARHAELIERLRWISFRFGVQGPALLETLKPLLAARRPHLRIAVGRTARRSHRNALISSLGEMGYRVERFAGDGAGDLGPITAANAMGWKRLDLLASP